MIFKSLNNPFFRLLWKIASKKLGCKGENWNRLLAIHWWPWQIEIPFRLSASSLLIFRFHLTTFWNKNQNIQLVTFCSQLLEPNFTKNFNLQLTIQNNLQFQFSAFQLLALRFWSQNNCDSVYSIWLCCPVWKYTFIRILYDKISLVLELCLYNTVPRYLYHSFRWSSIVSPTLWLYIACWRNKKWRYCNFRSKNITS